MVTTDKQLLTKLVGPLDPDVEYEILERVAIRVDSGIDQRAAMLKTLQEYKAQ